MALLIPILFALCLVAASLGWAARRPAVADPNRTDLAVLRIDIAVTVVCAVLVGAAALFAAATDPGATPLLMATHVLAVVTAAWTGAAVVRVVLAVGGIPTRADNHDDDPEAPLRGGRVIGMLERTAVAASLLFAWPAGIGIILAVKSLARFSELRAPHASEQFILGTFASVLWASAIAGVSILAGL